jgi:hypothetical protein
MDNLASYLMSRAPNGMSYQDAAKLCIWLYLCVEGVPEELLPLSREILADEFAKLARAGWVKHDMLYDSFISITESAYWLKVINDIFIHYVPYCELALGESLARQVGFVRVPKKQPAS